MVRRTRRSLLQTVGIAITALGAGCVGNATNTPTSSRTATQAERGAATQGEVAEMPTVDERVDAEPPGSPALAPSGTWPAPRFDSANTGWNPDGAGLRDGTTYWRLNAGGPAAVADGTLYNVSTRDRETTALTARDPPTASVDTSSDLVGYGINEPPVVSDGHVFITTFIEVFCFDAQSGEQLWRGPEMDGIRGKPAVHEDRVLVNTSGFQAVDPQLRAFGTSDGTELWSYNTGAESDSTPAVGDGTVFISSADGLHAIDLASGEESFLISDVATEQSSPVVDSNTVFAIAHNHSAERDELVALATNDGTEQWRVTVETDSPPVVTDDAVYAPVDGAIAELDRANGSVRTSGSRQAAPVGLVGDVLYAVDEGTVRAFDSAAGLEQLWAVSTEEVQINDTIGQTVYHVTPVDGAVYVSARDAFYGIGPVDQ